MLFLLYISSTFPETLKERFLRDTRFVPRRASLFSLCRHPCGNLMGCFVINTNFFNFFKGMDEHSIRFRKGDRDPGGRHRPERTEGGSSPRGRGRSIRRSPCEGVAMGGDTGVGADMGKRHASGVTSPINGDAVQPGRRFVRFGKQPRTMAQGIFQHGFQIRHGCTST